MERKDSIIQPSLKKPPNSIPIHSRPFTPNFKHEPFLYISFINTNYLKVLWRIKKSTSTITKSTFLHKALPIPSTTTNPSPISTNSPPLINKSIPSKTNPLSSKPTTPWNNGKIYLNINNHNFYIFYNIKKPLMVFNISSIWDKKINMEHNFFKISNQMHSKIIIVMPINLINFSEDKDKKVIEMPSKVLYFPFIKK